MTNDESRTDLARRLAEAYIGWHLGIPDQTARQMAKDTQPSEFWHDLADECIEAVRRTADRAGVAEDPGNHNYVN